MGFFLQVVIQCVSQTYFTSYIEPALMYKDAVFSVLFLYDNETPEPPVPVEWQDGSWQLRAGVD